MKIVYKCEELILRELDDAIELCLVRKGYEFIGSGYDFKKKERDLQYEIKEKKK